MREVMGHRSVHERIAKLLSISHGQPVSADLLEFVANADDWPKRTRELRYLGWEISVTKRRNEGGRVKSYYVLERQGNWPPDMAKTIRDFERERAIRNREPSLDDDQ
ncbi:hypothetical protein PUN4_780040 [Paraburkholderia unamae]|nr:hypothetical protein PUN4_780040 [Paraburkholderia unamae]